MHQSDIPKHLLSSIPNYFFETTKLTYQIFLIFCVPFFNFLPSLSSSLRFLDANPVFADFFYEMYQFIRPECICKCFISGNLMPHLQYPFHIVSDYHCIFIYNQYIVDFFFVMMPVRIDVSTKNALQILVEIPSS